MSGLSLSLHVTAHRQLFSSIFQYIGAVVRRCIHIHGCFIKFSSRMRESKLSLGCCAVSMGQHLTGERAE